MEHSSVISVLTGYLAGGVLIIGYLIYNWKIFKGTTRPNTATWALWAFIVGLNALTYDKMSADHIKAIVSIASGAFCIFTFLFSLFTGKFKSLDSWDKSILVIGLIAIGVWYYFKSATYANMLLQVAIVISFVPILHSVWKEPDSENWLPWMVWVTAYTVSIITVIMRWNVGWDIVYPINGFIMHGIVALFSIRRQPAPPNRL